MGWATTVNLQNPTGTINRSGRSAAGSLTEIELISAVSVPSGDQHHITDLVFDVARGAAGTIFRLYARAASTDSWTQIGEIECGDYGAYTRTYGVSKKIPGGHQWRLTLQQTTIARAGAEVHGVAALADVRDYT